MKPIYQPNHNTTFWLFTPWVNCYFVLSNINFCVMFKIMTSSRKCKLQLFVLSKHASNLKASINTSAADCARELLKPSKDSASLLVCSRKNFLVGLQIFCEWRHKWSSFWAIMAHVTCRRAQPLGQSILLKFSLEIRLKSDSFWAFDQLSRVSCSKVMIWNKQIN